MNIFEKLLAIQQELKAPKNQYNSFGKYNYRSCEDILEAVKPLCAKYGALLTIKDELVYMGDRYYIKATAALVDTVVSEHYVSNIENTAFAREEETKKGMDGSQITGTASSYARKYALNGLFCIDDTKDADTDAYKKQQEKPEAKISNNIQETIINKITTYAEIKQGNGDELLKYYLKQLKVNSINELTEKQGNALLNEVTKLLERSKN